MSSAKNKEPVTIKDVISGVFVLIVIIYFGLQVFTDSDDNSAASVANTYLQHKDSTLKEIKELSLSTREKITAGFFAENNATFNELGEAKAKACLSDYIHTKSENFPLATMATWCLDSAKQNRDFNQYIDREIFEKHFSVWDGSFTPLVALIKSLMNDPDSFDHVTTGYRLSSRKNGNFAVVRMTYRGRNAYNAVMTSTVIVEADPVSGAIVKVIAEE